jgi:hypothetical protein
MKNTSPQGHLAVNMHKKSAKNYERKIMLPEHGKWRQQIKQKRSLIRLSAAMHRKGSRTHKYMGFGEKLPCSGSP